MDWKRFILFRPEAQREAFRMSEFPEMGEEETPPAISPCLSENLRAVREHFCAASNSDIILREFSLKNRVGAFLVQIDGMADLRTTAEFLLRPLMTTPLTGVVTEKMLCDTIQISDVSVTERFEEAVGEVLNGNTALFVDGLDRAIVCETKGYERRGVEKPENETTIKGAQEAFTENLRTNTTLIHRILRNPRLMNETVRVGALNRGNCAVLYLRGLTNPSLVREVKRRLRGLSGDFLYGSGMIEQMIEDAPFRLLPNLLSTERPDAAALHLSQGRVVILVDGTPNALILPVGISNLIKSPEDVQLRWQYATVSRLTRLIGITLSALLPGCFVAIVNFHRGMIPTELLIAIAQAQENVPLPSMAEILLMEFSFELIREAGIRVPGVIGNTIGIVGGLILGQAAATAKLISPLTIIVIALTGISSFSIPDASFSFGIRMIRVVMILLGGWFGFVGLGLGITLFTGMAACQTSFGVAEFGGRFSDRGEDSIVYNPPPWKKENRPEEVHPGWLRMQPHISRRWILNRGEPHEK